MHYFLTIFFSIIIISISTTLVKANECQVIVGPNESLKTIQAGIDKAKAGEIVCIKGGTYTFSNTNQPPININKTGLTVKNFDSKSVVIDGKNNYPLGALNPRTGLPPYTPLVIINANQVLVDGIHVRNSRGRGITIHQDAKNTILQNSSADQTGNQAISIQGDYHTSTNVKASRGNDNFHLLRRRKAGATFQIIGNHITVSGCEVTQSYNDPLVVAQSTDISVSKCKLFDNDHGGIYVGQGQDVTIDSNQIYRTKQAPDGAGYSKGVSIGQEARTGEVVITQNITITNNVIVNYADGIRLGIGFDVDPEGNKFPIPWAGFKNIKIAGNTIINSSENGIVFNDNSTHQNHTPSEAVNNIIYTEGLAIRSNTHEALTEFTFKNNIFSNNSFPEYINGNDNQIIPDPQLTNPNAVLSKPSDYHLQNYLLTNSSPAINQGLNINYSDHDILGYSRPMGNKYDIGAHEFGDTPISPQPNEWDLNDDDDINLFDLPHLILEFTSTYSFPSLSSFLSNL